jgi:hypothetical protein
VYYHQEAGVLDEPKCAPFECIPKPLDWALGGSDFQALRREVIANGYERVLTLPANQQDRLQCTSLEQVAQMRLTQVDQAGRQHRLDLVDIFAALLYTGTDVQHDMHISHRRNIDFRRWGSLRTNLMAAVSKLSRDLRLTDWRYCDHQHPWSLEPLDADIVNSEDGWTFEVNEGNRNYAVASHADYGDWVAERIVLYTGFKDCIFDDRLILQKRKEARLRQHRLDHPSFPVVEPVDLNPENTFAPLHAQYCDFLSSSLSMSLTILSAGVVVVYFSELPPLTSRPQMSAHFQNFPKSRRSYLIHASCTSHTHHLAYLDMAVNGIC